MRMKTTLLALLASLFAAAAFAGDAEIVAAAYPQRLIDQYVADFQEGSAPPVTFQAFAPLGDVLVDAYTNGFTGAIRVIRRDGSVADDPALRISGIVPKVETVNLDGTGGDEVIVSFSSPRGRDSQWVFSWNGTALQLIGPSATDENGVVYTTLIDGGWADLDGDGTLELYAPGPSDGNDGEPAPGPMTLDVYRLSSGHYVPAPPVNYVRHFVRHMASPAAVSDTIRVSRTDVAYRMRVISDGVSSATISVDGTVVLSPHDFNQQVRQLIVPVSLQAASTLAVELAGAPGSGLLIVIEPAP